MYIKAIKASVRRAANGPQSFWIAIARMSAASLCMADGGQVGRGRRHLAHDEGVASAWVPRAGARELGRPAQCPCFLGTETRCQRKRVTGLDRKAISNGQDWEFSTLRF